MVWANFKGEERRKMKKKNVVGDNPARNNQHLLSFKKQDVVENSMT